MNNLFYLKKINIPVRNVKLSHFIRITIENLNFLLVVLTVNITDEMFVRKGFSHTNFRGHNSQLLHNSLGYFMINFRSQVVVDYNASTHVPHRC